MRARRLSSLFFSRAPAPSFHRRAAPRRSPSALFLSLARSPLRLRLSSPRVFYLARRLSCFFSATRFFHPLSFSFSLSLSRCRVDVYSWLNEEEVCALSLRARSELCLPTSVRAIAMSFGPRGCRTPSSSYLLLCRAYFPLSLPRSASLEMSKSSAFAVLRSLGQLRSSLSLPGWMSGPSGLANLAALPFQCFYQRFFFM